jgi:transposase
MLIIGCDFHPGFQQVAIFDNRRGEIQEKRLQHRAEAEQFYRSLAGQEVRVGMEACGHYPWFERLLEELGIELWFGDAAKVRASVVRKQKTDRRDAEHVLRLLLEDRVTVWRRLVVAKAACVPRRLVGGRNHRQRRRRGVRPTRAISRRQKAGSSATPSLALRLRSE